MNDEKIARINALYHKSKAEGLTPAEKEEQQKLRKEYIEAIRGNMRATLDHTSIKNADGSITPLKMVRQQNMAKKTESVKHNISLKDAASGEQNISLPGGMESAGNQTEIIAGQQKSDIYAKQAMQSTSNKNAERESDPSDKVVNLDKQRIRIELTEKRNALALREVNQRSGIICYHVLQSETYKNTSSICVYQAFRNEVSCSDIVEQAFADGKQVFVPVVDMEKKEMDFFEITPETKWRESAYGIQEPIVNEDTKQLSETALVIMPGLAFDRNKHRIGYGGGYYDKYLGEHKEHITMALCYNFQIVEEDLPCNEQDVLPEFVVTEDGFF